MALRESLAQSAIDCLHFSSDHRSPESEGESASRHAIRGVIGPDSWLLQQCWHALADKGHGIEALSVASLLEVRQPLAPIQAIYRLGKQSAQHPHLAPLIQAELLHTREQLFGHHLFAESSHQIDHLLYAGAAAASIGDYQFAISCLERLDQEAKAWDRVFIHPELRQILAEAVAGVGLTPLTNHLIDKAILFFSDSGAQFLQQIAVSTQEIKSVKGKHILNRCVLAMQRAVLGSLHSRKVAASIFAQAGQVDEVLTQVRTIATIQDAHRETNAMLNQRGSSVSQPEPRLDIQSSGTYNETVKISEIATATASQRSRAFPVYRAATSLHSDSSVIRQISRTSADADVDFLVYTLKSAVESLDLSQISDDKRRILINQLAALGIMSDGWTGAGATAALLKLGGIQEAIAVIEQTNPTDPTKVEGILALVRGLLEVGDVETAQAQSRLALSWAEGLIEQAPGRTLRWDLATLYLEHNLPEIALQILEREEPNKGEWRHTIHRFVTGRWFGDEFSDEQLQTDRLRLAAHLKQMIAIDMEPYERQANENPSANENGPESQSSEPDASTMQSALTYSDVPLPPDVDKLVRELSGWASHILDGEALISFYINSLLLPLVEAGKFRYAWGLLPYIKEALLRLQSNKMAARINQVGQPLAAQISQIISEEDEEATGSPVETMQFYFADFLIDLWHHCSARGIWPTIYAIEGSLSSVITLIGPETIVEIAQSVSEESALWERG
ncbi:MAG: hypothetical protein AAF702_26310 [Chloroflexota bacterium]